MSGYHKPLPVIDEHSAPFWRAARERELKLPKCTSCGALRTHFEPWCAECGSEAFEWVRLSGRGKVWSHCNFHKAYFAGFKEEVPYNVSIVELDEGPHLYTNLVGIEYSEIHIGMPVRAHFDDVTPEVTLIKFKPA
jgi:uncharacterized OB-fold protein